MIEFLEDVHAYVNDGILIPSVSELIRFKFPEAYKGIPDKVLKKKANYGTKGHQTIERFINKEFTIEEMQKMNIDPNIKMAVEQFEVLRKMWAFQIKDMEQIVSWQGRYAGTYDLLTLDDYIIDIKFTSELHEEWLKWQIGLYYMAKGIKKDFGFVMWFPKGKMAKVQQINVIPWDQLEQLVKDYEEYSPRES